MANPVVGYTTCRCGAEGAEVRQGEKGKLYEVCDECVGQYRAMSAAGQRGIRERMRPLGTLITPIAGGGVMVSQDDGAGGDAREVKPAAEQKPKPEKKKEGGTWLGL